MRTRVALILGALTVVGLLVVATPSAYVFLTNGTWSRGATVTMYLQLGTRTDLMLDDGATSWNEVARSAVSIWDRQLGSIDFVGRIENRSRVSGDGVNDVYFAETMNGDAWGDVLGTTMMWTRGGHRVEADVIFNSTKTWNSYRGRVIPRVVDFRRVALHLFGTVLGLGQPDGAGQSVAAVMNRQIGHVDDLQDDDIRGIRALYGEPPAPPGLVLPPRPDTIDFRHLMETEYRNRGAAGQTTFVDINAAAIWLAEYVWYRVSLCDHATATARVFAQLEGRGVQPVCGPIAVIERLPEPEEAVAFREALETEFRDFLKGPPNDYLIGGSDEAYLVREYLYLRFTGVDHRQATTRLRAPFRPTPTPRPSPSPAPPPAPPPPQPQPQPAPAPAPPPAPGGGRFDGTFDFFITFPTGPGTSGSQNVSRFLRITNGVVSSTDAKTSGTVDQFGVIRFSRPCPLNSSIADFVGNMNDSALAGANFGQGGYACRERITGSQTWQARQSR